MSTTPRRTKTFATFLDEATKQKIDATRFEQDIVNAWNAWSQVAKESPKDVATVAKAKSSGAADRMLAIEPRNYQHPYAQRVAAQIAWQLRTDQPKVTATSLSKEASLPAKRDAGSGSLSKGDILTPHYTSAGVSSVTSKTDILLGTARCSMKNADAAQFGSAQHGEMTAIISAAWSQKEREVFKSELKDVFAATLDKSVFYDLAKKYMMQPKIYKPVLQKYKVASVDKLPTKGQEELQAAYQNAFSRRINFHSSQAPLTPKEANDFDAFLEKYLPDVDTNILGRLRVQMDKTVFRKRLFREMLTGELRFQGAAKEKIADHMLLWNDVGGVRVYTVDQYLDKHYTHFNFSIRDRGSRRGAAARSGTAPEKIAAPTGQTPVDMASRTFNGRLIAELREQANLLEHTYLTEGVGDWLGQAAKGIADLIAVPLAKAKTWLTQVWQSFKDAILRMFEKVLDLLDRSVKAFMDAFGFETEGTVEIPAEAIPDMPDTQQVIDVSGDSTPA